MNRVGFLRWRSSLPSGGNRYDDELVSRLPAMGIDLHVHDVDGAWPLPTDEDRRRVAEVLTLEESWLIGNIVASAVPDLLRANVAAGRQIALLLHYFPADDPELSSAASQRLAAAECEATLAASSVVVTSSWAAREVARRHGRGDVVVAPPGVDPSPLAQGSCSAGGPASLLWLGRITEAKDPLTFIQALADVSDLDWSARLVGPDTVDAELTREVHGRIRAAGLLGRVGLPGSRDGDDLQAIWRGTDLLVHTSLAETYGMVVSEALSRGIPAVVVAGTGAVEAQLGTGATFPPGDPVALSQTLRVWLGDHRLQAIWRRDAVSRRACLPTWEAAASAVASVL